MTITIENSVSLVINSLPPARTVLNYGGVKVKRLKTTQKDCVNKLLNARCSSIDSPTGSGKSVSIMVIAAAFDRAVYVENVLDARFATFFERRGYKLVDAQAVGMSSWIKLKGAIA